MFIDVYGESESYFQAEISPEGYAILENIGTSKFKWSIS
jgi:hypothetical protein